MSRKCTWNSSAYAAGANGPNPGPFWPSGGIGREGQACGSWWKLGPLGLAAMIFGFILWWPIGLAILFYNIFRRRGGEMPIADLFDRARAPFTASTGNVAFDDWRRAEIERIERERQKLADAEREFSMFVTDLRRAKDREEFERFMAARTSAGPGGNTVA
ncbi:MAG: DUF2852 domain-containing protein [Proteobacteria bacterium]|nr:DUF2852 domain-containing protein [Pseudomonadota bacterium]